MVNKIYILLMLYEFVITIRITVRNENPLNAMEAYRGV